MTDTLTQKMISYALASEAIAAGIAAAQDRKVALSFVVLDAAGHLVAAARMDGAAFITVEVARGKAFASAATGGQPGFDLGQRYRDNPMVWGNVSALGFGAPLLPAQGALPIFLEGQFIGVMGASGAPSEIDDAVVTAAIQAVGCTVSA